MSITHAAHGSPITGTNYDAAHIGNIAQGGSLKPSVPLDDFDAASLDGAWSAHSGAGTFATTDCFTQALDGSHVSLGFNAKNGSIYRSTTNIDQEWLAGGMRATMPSDQAWMLGIAVLDSSGTGVGVLSYNDGNVYLGSITTWGYAGILQTISGYGHGTAGVGAGSDAIYAMRLTRVGNSWTGYVSMDGNNWVASASSNTTITAANLAVGLFYDPTGLYRGRMVCDWVHKV